MRFQCGLCELQLVPRQHLILPSPRLESILLHMEAQPRALGNAVGQAGAGAHGGKGYALDRYIR